MKYQSTGNDIGLTELVLYDNHRFLISCDWVTSDEEPAYSTQFSGTYREWENVYDLHFDRVCVNQENCVKPRVEALHELFSYSYEGGPLRNNAHIYRINKNPQQLYLNGMLMQRVQ